MAMTLRPTDGLVTRLLQQQTRSQPTVAETSPSSLHKTDSVNISNQARNQGQGTLFKQQELESHLLRLYSYHDTQEG